MGGPEVRTVLLMNVLSDRFRHTVLALNGNLQMRDLVSADVDIAYSEPGVDGKWWSRIRQIAKRIRHIGPDLVLTYGWGGTDALIANRLANIAPAVHAEDGFLPEEAIVQKKKRLYYRRAIFRFARRLVVPSKTLENIAGHTWWIPERKLSYIPNGVDTGRFSPASETTDSDWARQWGIDRARMVIGTVGALRPEKNQARLIKTTSRMLAQKNVHLLIVGDGPERAALESQARDLGVHDFVHFTGNISDPSHCYRLMDVFALTSDTEQMPISLLEAMATGLPVAGTDVGDIRSMVAPENESLIVAKESEHALARAFETLLEDSELRSMLGQKNRHKCLSEFSEQTMISNYEQLYLAGLNGKCKPLSATRAATLAPELK